MNYLDRSVHQLCLGHRDGVTRAGVTGHTPRPCPQSTQNMRSGGKTETIAIRIDFATADARCLPFLQ